MATPTIDTGIKVRNTLNHGNDFNAIADILVRAELATYDKGVLQMLPEKESTNSDVKR